MEDALNPRVALWTGILLGLLLNAKSEYVIMLEPRPVMDGNDYTNVIELCDPEGPVLTISVDLAERR